MTHEHAHDHAAFRESIAVALTGGLSAAEQAGFDAHRAACAECAAEFERARDAEARIAALLAPELPGAGFEDRMIQRLRESASSARDLRIWRPNWRIHPALGKAVAGVAAAIVLGGVGYAVNGVINPGGRNFTSTKNLSYSYQNPYPTTQAMGSGFKLNNALGTEFAVAGDALDRFAQADQAGLPVVPVRSGGEKTVYFEDGHRSDDFGETRGDAAGRGESAVVAGRPVDANLGRPPLNLQQQSAPHGWFKPTELATGQPANPPSAGSVIIPGQTPAITEGAEPQAAGGRRSGRGSTVTATDQPASGGIAGTAGGVTLVPAPPPAAGERAIGQQRGQQSEERQRTVADLETQAERLNAEGRPAEARAVAEQIRVLDPENRLALAAANLPTAPRAADAAAATQPAQRRVIRNGEMSFEVDRFDSAFAQVSKLTSEAGGFVGTSSSQKLPNGKVQGKVALRVAPDRLDTLVLQLRGIGDLTSQSLEAQDVSKRYTDLESQLRAARAMEDRLIAIIKEGKGQIKDLLAAEKELGVWRTKVEELTGEMKYYDNLVAMATLNLTLTERDIATPATARESENVDAGIESEDVEQARAAALKAIEEAKGRVVQSELKRYDAGQFGATIVADVPPDAAGPLLDRLKQIGKVARLDVQRKQTADDSKPRNAATNAPVRVERRDTRFNLLIYNLANVAPRETTTLSLAADDVEKGYQAIRDRVTKAGGRILSSNLNRQKPEQTTGTIAFEVPSAEADAVTNDLRAAGEAMTLTAAANPDVQNVTTAKRGFNVSIIATAAVTPRETATIQLAAPDVAQAREKILAVATTQAAHIRAAALNENDRQNVTATLELDVKRTALPAVEKALADAGQVVKRTSSRAADAEHTLDTKVRLSLTLLPADRLPPRETTTLTVEMKDVESAMASLQTAASEVGGRVVVSTLQKDRDGRGVARVAVDVPQEKAGEIVRRARELGVVRAIDASKDLQVPPGPLARARVDLTFANADTLVAPERGVFASIRRGLSTSLAGLMRSLELIIIGVCFVLPWALVVYAIWRLIKRRRATTEPTPAPA